MIKNVKRILSIIISVSMCFIYPVNSFALSQQIQKDDLNESKLSEFNHEFELEENDIWETYDEIDGVKYYFKDTPEYTLNVIKDSITRVYLKDKKADILKVYEDDSNTATTDKMFNTIEKDVFNSNYRLISQDIRQSFEKLNLKEEYKVSDFKIGELRTTDYEIAKRIDNKLSEYYGSPYSNKLIDSLSEKGKYAKLYESMHFECYKHLNWWFDAGTTIGVVATIVSWPTTIIGTIFATFTTATGVASLVNSFNSYEYVANVHWNKEVQVGSIYPYRAGKTIKGRVLVGDIDESYRKGKTNKHSDFDDNKLLMRTGINNAIHLN